MNSLRTKTHNHRWKGVILTVSVCSMLLPASQPVSAEAIGSSFSFAPNAAAAWPSVDFNSDGVTDISFLFSSLISNGSGAGVAYLNVVGNGSNQVLSQGGSVLPLDPGSTVSLTPVSGSWMNAVPGVNVWTQPSSGEVFGVAGTGMGSYLGVKFAVGSQWNLGWIRFGVLPAGTPLNLPSVLEYAYETTPGAAISVPEPHGALIATASVLVFGTKRFFPSRRRLASR